MAHWKRTLGRLLEREAHHLESLVKPLRWLRPDRRAPPRRVEARIARGGRICGKPGKPGKPRGPGGPGKGSGVLSFGLSILLHAAVGFILLRLVPAKLAAVKDRGPTPPITVRLVVAPIKPVEKAILPPPPAPPRDTGRPRSQEKGASRPERREEAKPSSAQTPPGSSTTSVSPPLAPRPRDLEVAARPHLLPLPLGLGSVPPLPSGGARGSPGGFPSRITGKARALSLYGGGGNTEGAVARGLRWLADHQDEDGGWSADGFRRHCRHVVACSGRGLSEFDAGLTALAVLAFLGAGHLPDAAPGAGPATSGSTEGADASPYRRIVRKGLAYLLEHQDGSGAFGACGESYLYNHAIATLALCEAYTLTGLRRYRDSAEAAVSLSVLTQQGGGGWDYTSRASGRNDLSITGWQVMALRAASSAGISVPDSTLEKVRHFLDVAVSPDGTAVYANLGQEAGRRGINMVAVGLLSRLYLGSLPSEERVKRAAERILRAPPDLEATGAWERTYQSHYYWYTATLGLFHLGGDAWKAWNLFLLRAVLPLQGQKGHEDGSWPPEASWIGISGGRVYATAICVLTLETYYRYEPLFKARKS